MEKDKQFFYRFAPSFILFSFLSILIFTLRKEKIFLVPFIIITLIAVVKSGIDFKNNYIIKIYFVFWIYYITITVLNILVKSNEYRYYNDFVISKFIELVVRFCIVICIYLMVKLIKNNEKKFFLALRNIGIIICIIGLLEFIMKRSLFYNLTIVSERNWQLDVWGTSQFRIFTIFLHPIVYGMFLNVLYWVMKNYPINNYYICKVCELLIFINLFATKSRSAWIPFVVTIIIDFIMRKKIIKKRMRFSLRSCICIFIFFIMIIIFREKLIEILNVIISRFSIVLDPSSVDGSRTQRLGAIKNISLFIKEESIKSLVGCGVGYGTIFMINNPVNDGFNIVDNQYFSLILETGIIGVIFILSLLFFILINIKKYYINNVNKVCIINIITIYIGMFFYEGLAWYGTLFLLTLFIVLLDTGASMKSEN